MRVRSGLFDEGLHDFLQHQWNHIDDENRTFSLPSIRARLSVARITFQRALTRHVGEL
jgi:hypothetical protein